MYLLHVQLHGLVIAVTGVEPRLWGSPWNSFRSGVFAMKNSDYNAF